MEGFHWLTSMLTSGEFWSGIGTTVVLATIIHSVLRRRKYRVSYVSLNLPFGLGNVMYEATGLSRGSCTSS